MKNVENLLGFEPIGSMTFGDALWSQEGMGIYIFYKDNYVPLYIGKVASRSFLERISGHMDTHVHKGPVRVLVKSAIVAKSGMA